MKKILFITALKNIKIKVPTGHGLRIFKDMKLTNDSEKILSLVTDEFDYFVGALEKYDILESPGVIYSIEEVNEKSFVPQNYLKLRLYITKAFISSLWFVKDNSVNSELGFIRYDLDNKITFDSNYINVLYTNHSGKIDSVEFSVDELRTARKYFSEIFKIDDLTDDVEIYESIFKNEIPRFYRSFIFLQSSRTESKIPLKIANQITALEAMLSTNPIELSHQMSERTAILLGKDSKTRIEIYNNIKKAYSIRSRVLHGDSISGKQRANTELISKYSNEYLRELYIKIIESKELNKLFESEKEKIEEYFKELLFAI